jgi:hypothetical protein
MIQQCKKLPRVPARDPRRTQRAAGGEGARAQSQPLLIRASIDIVLPEEKKMRSILSAILLLAAASIAVDGYPMMLELAEASERVSNDAFIQLLLMMIYNRISSRLT